MSTFGDYNPSDPPGSDNGLPHSVIIAMVLIALITVGFIILICVTILKMASVVEVSPAVNVAKLKRVSVVEVSPVVNVTKLKRVSVVEVWTIDAPTMENFLQDLAKERPVRFTAQQLCRFTNNYSKVLGSGSFGIVYKGRFPHGVKIAVKVLKRSLLDKRAKPQFMAEVSTIGRTYHINLVRLYGFSYNNSLCAARGIAYLHEECEQRIIHYDIKPGTVLLDVNFIPKVADFGLAKICNRDNTHDSPTGHKETPGYSAPEFLLNNYPITYKCDIYSFGMLLFEIVGRKRNARVGSTDSLDWFPKLVWDKYEKDEPATMTLSHGIEEKDRETAQRMAVVALWCVLDSPKARPPMSAVVKMLEGGVEIMPPPKPFRHLFSIGFNVLNPRTSNSLDNSTGYGTNSYWYKEHTTTIMAKYEIQIASSSSEMGNP